MWLSETEELIPQILKPMVRPRPLPQWLPAPAQTMHTDGAKRNDVSTKPVLAGSALCHKTCAQPRAATKGYMEDLLHQMRCPSCQLGLDRPLQVLNSSAVETPAGARETTRQQRHKHLLSLLRVCGGG